MARPRDSAIDGAVVEACAQLLGEVGRANLTRQLVARRAGVSLPAVTRRFLSVDDLILAVATRPRPSRPIPPAPVDLQAYLVAVILDLTGGDAPGRGRRTVAELVAAAAGDPRIARALVAAEETVRQGPLGVLQAAQDRGDLPAGVEVEHLLDQLIGLVRYRLLWFGEPISESSVNQLVERALSSR